MAALKRKAKQPEDVPIMMERELSASIVSAARECGWLVNRPWLSKFSPPGFPDLCMVKDGRLAFWELKSIKGKVSPAQQGWLDELAKVEGVDVRVVRQADLEEAYRFLATSQSDHSAGGR